MSKYVKSNPQLSHLLKDKKISKTVGVRSSLSKRQITCSSIEHTGERSLRGQDDVAKGFIEEELASKGAKHLISE